MRVRRLRSGFTWGAIPPFSDINDAPEGEDNLPGQIEDVQLPVEVPTLYRGPSIDLRFTCTSAEKGGDEQTRTADLISLRVIGRGILGVAKSVYVGGFLAPAPPNIAGYCARFSSE